MTYVRFAPALLMCWLATVVDAQVMIDDFSDLDFVTGTLWEGNQDNFIVNAAQQLQLNDDVAAQSVLYTGFSDTPLAQKEWRFWIHQSFAGSDNNQSRVYFAAQGIPGNYTGAGSAGVTGYFLKFGEAGSLDKIKLCRDDGTGSITELAESTDDISGGVLLYIRILCDDVGNFTVYVSGSGVDYSFTCAANDASYSSCTYLGLICNYTVSNADNFTFDDFYFGDIITDEAPPGLVSATVTGTNTLDLIFDEPVDPVSAGNNNFYFAEGLGISASAVPDGINSALVHLTFTADFEPNVLYTLMVVGVQDLEGNTMPPDVSIEFMWYVPVEATFRDVVFNEVLADPTPVVGMPDAEFIELFNASDNVYELEGWQLVNSLTPKTLPSYSLLPGAFVVLCDDDYNGQFENMIGLSAFTALTNSGDSLTLLDQNGALIDLLVYDIAWYDTPDKADGGWSLEQINPFLPCLNSGNWQESSDSNGGTPGSVNSVFNDAPDAVDPVIVEWNIAHPDSLHLVFSETMDTTGWSLPDWSLIPFNGIVGATWNASLNEVWLAVQSPLNPPGIWQLTVTGISDCSGNTLTDITLDFVAAYTPMPGDLIINEIMADPDPALLMPAAEYLELYNKSEVTIDLNGVMINDALIATQVLMLPGSYLVVGDAGDAPAFFTLTNKLLLDDFPSLTNSGATLTLTAADGTTLDEVSYTDAWYLDTEKDDGGWSLELINPDDPCSDATNWKASEDERGGTAGEVNSVLDLTPDTTGPQLLYVVNEPQESITLVFNEPVDPSSLPGISFTVNGENIPNANAQFYDASGQWIILYYGELEAGVVYSFEVLGIEDCWGNSAGLLTGTFMLGVDPEDGDIVINEILFNPVEGGSDYVELYNRSPRAISLAGWMIANAENGVADQSDIITDNELVLLPGSYLLLTEDATILPTVYPFTHIDRIWIIESLPTYNVASGEAMLIRPDLSPSDHMSYRDDMHFDLLNSTDGVSLERIDPFRTSEDETNWHSAAESQGFGTPGYLNSQTWFGDFDPEGLSVDPEIFSPDNDGYQDVLNIHYADDTPGMVADVVIFDSEGREVRHLTQNQLLGANTTISWDGTTDENLLAPVGVYILYFEVFSTDGRVVKYKKSCVLAHQLGN